MSVPNSGFHAGNLPTFDVRVHSSACTQVNLNESLVNVRYDGDENPEKHGQQREKYSLRYEGTRLWGRAGLCMRVAK